MTQILKLALFLLLLPFAMLIGGLLNRRGRRLRE